MASASVVPMPRVASRMPELVICLSYRDSMPPTAPPPHDDDAEAPPVHAVLHVVDDLVERLRILGDKDEIRAAGDAAHHREPAGIAAHDLDHHDAPVRLRRRVQAVERLTDDLDGRIEPDAPVGAAARRYRWSSARRRRRSRVPRASPKR